MAALGNGLLLPDYITITAKHHILEALLSKITRYSVQPKEPWPDDSETSYAIIIKF